MKFSRPPRESGRINDRRTIDIAYIASLRSLGSADRIQSDLGIPVVLSLLLPLLLPLHSVKSDFSQSITSLFTHTASCAASLSSLPPRARRCNYICTVWRGAAKLSEFSCRNFIDPPPVGAMIEATGRYIYKRGAGRGRPRC